MYIRDATYPEIFKRDTSGRIRVWKVERAGPAYRVLSGVLDGNLAATGWTVCEGKQGRNDIQQAQFEVESAYTYHLKREYFEHIEDIDKPRFFKPMLAKSYESFASGFAQPKLDGIRCIARISGLFTREGQPILGAPHIHNALAPIFLKDPDIILDGELYNHELRDDFNAIVSLVRRKEPDQRHLSQSRKLVQYHVYDLPSSDLPFGQRHRLLCEALDCLPRNVIQTVATHYLTDSDHYDVLHGEWLAAGYEGSMWRSDAQYEQKRSKSLLKRKEFQDSEYECVSIEEGTGNWAGLAKSVICRLPDGRTFGAGIKGNQQRAAELLSENHHVVTVQFFHLTPDGIPRFPVVTKFWGTTRDL